MVHAHSGSGEWSDRFRAVTATRTLLAHHITVFDGGQAGEGGGEEEDGVQALLAVVVGLVASAASDARSVLRTNGLRCMAELFRCVSGGHFCRP